MDRLSEYSAVWLPAGRATVFSGGVPPHLFRKDLVTGVEEQLIAAPRFTTAEDVSPDGKTLIFLQRTPRGTFDLWKMTPDAPQSASPMRQTPFDKSNARFSPDGRYIAFASNELGRYEVFVSPFPMTGEATRVSKGGRRSSPLESRRPRALLRLGRSSLGRRARPNVAVTRPGLSSTTVEVRGGSEWSDPRATAVWADFDVSTDGRRFLASIPEPANEQPLTVVLNWPQFATSSDKPRPARPVQMSMTEPDIGRHSGSLESRR